VQTAAGSGYASDSDTTWTFPAVFDDCALVLADAGALGRWASCGTPTSTNVVVRQHAWTSFSGAESVRVAAFGTWS
jgi:hypothetical protein